MSSSFRFPFIRPRLPEPEEWVPYLADSYRDRRYANGGPAVVRLERELTERYGSPEHEAVAVASGTAGLVAALIALDVRGPVILPSFTFAATAHAVVSAGCEPVFCEADAATWELDPSALRSLLERVDAGAVMHVRPFGLCRDLSPIEAICADAGVPLVVDSAAALGGFDERGVAVGRSGAAEVFSLHATKVLGIGEGGLVLADPDLIGKIRRAINFGFDEHGTPLGRGLNGKLAEPAAAIGLAVLDGAPQRIERRRAHAAAWATALAGREDLTLPTRPGDSVWPTQPLLLAGGAEDLVAALAAVGVQARHYYRPALHRTPAFRSGVRLPVTESLADRMICVPVYDDASPAEIDELCSLVLGALDATRLRAAA
jgi:dTDP-4-amino-4,6-dideoxygalactose transaminase